MSGARHALQRIPRPRDRRAWGVNRMNAALLPHEPSPEELERAASSYDLELLGFDPTPRKLAPNDYLARYHCIRFRVKCLRPFESRPLFITVRRLGSKMGAANFYTVPFHVAHLRLGEVALYELLAFDSFNQAFLGVSVEMCKPGDYVQRRVSVKHVQRAHHFARQLAEKGG